MGLIPKFTSEEFAKKLTEKFSKLDSLIIRNLSYLGEECVNLARDLGSYNDRTGNLRNSVGYVLVANGEVVKKNFERSAQIKTVISRGKNAGNERISKGSKDGLKAGEELAIQIANTHQTGYALIVVAGMNYALEVESKGKVVLTGAKQYAEQRAPVIINELKNQIGKMK